MNDLWQEYPKFTEYAPGQYRFAAVALDASIAGSELQLEYFLHRARLAGGTGVLYLSPALHNQPKHFILNSGAQSRLYPLHHPVALTAYDRPGIYVVGGMTGVARRLSHGGIVIPVGTPPTIGALITLTFNDKGVVTPAVTWIGDHPQDVREMP